MARRALVAHPRATRRRRGLGPTPAREHEAGGQPAARLLALRCFRSGYSRLNGTSVTEAIVPSAYCQISMKPEVTSPTSFQSSDVAAPS